MDPKKRGDVEARALSLIGAHFDHLNKGMLDLARKQLFFPRGMKEKPLDVYLDTMSRMVPFRILSLSIDKFQAPRDTRYGVQASIWIIAVVDCSLGRRSTHFIVWWNPEHDEVIIGARPSQWVLEFLRGQKPPRPN